MVLCKTGGDDMESKSQTNTIMIIGIVIVAVVVVLGALTFRNNSPTPTISNPTSTTQNQIAESTLAVSPEPTQADVTLTEEIQTVNLEAGSFYYKPNVITVKKGQKVRIVMKAADQMHNFNIDELGVKLPIVKSGNTGTVEFTADKLGTFEYYCSVVQHRANGQVGKLIVQ